MQSGLAVFPLVRKSQAFRQIKTLVLRGFRHDQAAFRQLISPDHALQRRIDEPFVIGRIEKYQVELFSDKPFQCLRGFAAQQARTILHANQRDVFPDDTAGGGRLIAQHSASRSS